MKTTLTKIFPYLIILILASCNVKKDLTKSVSKENLHTETETKIDRTITEKIDTTIVIKADTLKGFSANLDSNSIVIEDENLILTVVKDKKGVHAKAVKKVQKIHAFKDKSTIERIDASEKTESQIFTKTKEKQVERTGGLNFNYLWWLLVPICIGIYLIIKRYF